MTSKFFSKLIFAWMIIWLPVSGTLAAVMPLSNIGKTMSVLLAQADLGSAANSDESATPCHGNTGDSARVQSCSHCALCHLTASPAFTIPAMYSPPIPQVFSVLSAADHASFIPAQPIPPPRLSLA